MKENFLSTKPRLLLLCVLKAVFFGSGCATYNIHAGPDRRPGSEWSEPQPLNAWLWGTFRDDTAARARTAANGTRIGLDSVKVEVFLLPTILTGGIWIPGQASYRYAQSPPPTGSIKPLR
jgi:hypothetical protein